ncbi:circumsporozoite protein- membrane associated protein [Rhodopirellula halodulae]|uniref:circumsporozoite protein- membrane associated protein n=1 Tax=Rhodopirellula halodulae TaxID=2894198 RepID=UPI001E588F22|nr:circumsporozoite protein- membrane associated protein [Rhodopirellula sp. JC737]MCC9654817.1 circumsporozoite protein- membrane associated protein [Rhodopirellula sp. JC737]
MIAHTEGDAELIRSGLHRLSIASSPPTSVSQPPRSSSKDSRRGAATGKSNFDALIQERIDEARGALWRAELTRQVLLGVMVGMAALLAWVIMDHWIWSPGNWGRAIAALLGLVALGLHIQRSVWPVLRSSVRADYAARALERDHPELGHALSSYIALKQQNTDRSASKGQLSTRVVQSIGASTAAKLRSIDALPEEATGLLRWWIATIALLAVLAIYALASPKNSLQSAVRLMAPAADIRPPNRVQIFDVQPGDAEVLAGRSVDVSVKVKGLKDDEPVQFRWLDQIAGAMEGLGSDSLSSDQVVELQRDEAASGASATTFVVSVPVSHQSTGVQRYEIVAGDSVAGPFEWKIRDTPVVSVTEVQYQPPAYTGETKRVRRSGSIRGVDGTRVTLRAKVNRSVARAVVEFNPKPMGQEIRATAGVREMDRSSDGRSLDLTFDLRSGKAATRAVELESYRIRVWDDAEQTNSEPIVYPIEVIRDLPPEITIVVPRKSPKPVPMDAQQLFEIHATDVDYGLSEIEVEIRRGIDLIARATLWKNAEGAKGNQIAEYRFRPSRMIIAGAGRRSGRSSRLMVGDEVEVVAIATDNRRDPDNPGIEPGVTRTEPVRLQIVAGREPNEQTPEEQDDNDGQTPDDGSTGEGSESGADGQSGGSGGSGESSESQDAGQNGEGQSGSGQSDSESTGENQSGDGSGDSQGNQDPDDSSNEGASDGEGTSGDSSGMNSQAEDSQGDGSDNSTEPGEAGDNAGGKASGSEAASNSEGGSNPEGSDPSGNQQPANDSGSSESEGGNAQSSNNGEGTESGSNNSDRGNSRDGDAGQGDSASSKSSQGDSGGSKSAPQDDAEAFERIREYLEEQDKRSGASEGGEGQDSDSSQQGASEQGSSGQNSPEQNSSDQNSSGQNSSQEGSDSQGGAGGEESNAGSSDQQDGTNSGDESGQSGSSDSEGGNSEAGSSSEGSDSGKPSGDGDSDGKQTSGEEGSSGDQTSSDPSRGSEPGESNSGQSSQDSSDGAGSSQTQSDGSSGNSNETSASENEAGQESASQNSPAGGSEQPGDRSEGMNASESNSQSGESSSFNGDSNAAGDQNGGNESGGEVPKADPADLEYTKQATDMVLDYLDETRQDPDPDLLERLKWSQDDLKRFRDRWQNVKPIDSSDPKAAVDPSELEEALRSLGMRAPNTMRSQSAPRPQDGMRGLRDSGNRRQAPAAVRDAFEAFRRNLGSQ